MQIDPDQYETMSSSKFLLPSPSPTAVPSPNSSKKRATSNLHKSFSSESLNTTLKYATEKTPANFPMVTVTDYHATHPEEVSVKSGCIVSALYKAGKYLFVRTSDNNTGFLPASAVRPLYSRSEFRTSSDKIYENVPACHGSSAISDSLRRYNHSSSCPSVVQSSCSNRCCRPQIFCNTHCRPQGFCNIHCHDNEPPYMERPMPVSRSQQQRHVCTRSSPRSDGNIDTSFDSCYSSSSGFSSSSHTEDYASQEYYSIRKLSPRYGCSGSQQSQAHCDCRTENDICTPTEKHIKPRQSAFKAKKGARLTVIFDFQRRFGGDISVNSHEVVTYLAGDGADWLWIRRSDGQEGFIPRNCVANLEALNLDPYSRTTYL